MSQQKITHLDLFSGIGGFSLAADWVWGKENVEHIFCEIEEFPQKVLRKHWPDAPIFPDIKELTGEKGLANTRARGLQEQNIRCEQQRRTKTIGTSKNGETGFCRGEHRSQQPALTLLTGGFPCQPYSVAGKQRGSEDDRALWPEMLRVIQETRPDWIIGENVGGFVNMGLDDCLSDLEGAGYDCQPLVIPACAVNAPHRRDRVWIVANRTEYGRGEGKQDNRGCSKGVDEGKEYRPLYGGETVADTKRQRQPRPWEPFITCNPKKDGKGKATEPVNGCFGDQWAVEPNVGRVASRLSSTLDETIRDYGYENADYQKAITEVDSIRREILREMWREQQEVKPPPHSKTPRSGDDLMYEVSCQRTHDKWKLGERFKSEPSLRDMWEQFCSTRLSQTKDLQTRMLERVREIERNEAVASSRTDRLKGLGNAIVPQVAAVIMQAIKEIEDGLM